MPAQCPICDCRQTRVVQISGHDRFDCDRCGTFDIGDRAADMAKNWRGGRDPEHPIRGCFATSHAIRRMQGKQPPIINEATLSQLWAEPLPNVRRQADLFILALGECDLAGDQYVEWLPDRWCAEIGTQDSPVDGGNRGFSYIRKRLIETKLIEANRHPEGPTAGARLTFEGWAEFERLRRDVVESKTAFMAMSFGNPNLSRMVVEHFTPAVAETGFQLFRVDQRPRPGLIDNRMRVEIRTAKFMICDLTDENRGAYWEAGFAEGLGRPVFYTCEGTKFDKVRTHFDTEHMYTIKWDLANPDVAMDELKAAIRNEFPAESIPPNLSK